MKISRADVLPLLISLESSITSLEGTLERAPIQSKEWLQLFLQIDSLKAMREELNSIYYGAENYEKMKAEH
jgi:hypothetical protein